MNRYPDKRSKIKPEVGQVYRVLRIDPQCEWYAERHYFENRMMKCVEVFEAEEEAGFCFIKRSDCPEQYDHLHAFSFHSPVLYGELIEGTRCSVEKACFFPPFSLSDVQIR